LSRLLDQNTQREWARQQRILLVLERRYSRRFAREIRAESYRIIDFYKATGEIPAPSAAHELELTVVETDLAKAATKAFGGRILDQGKASGLVLERKFDFAAFFQNVAMRWAADEMVRRRITNIAETTRSQIVRQVLRGQEEGLGVDQIATNIARNVSGIAKLRGALIARTETHGAANHGADASARETGLQLKKEWIAAEDERTRDQHRDVDGDIVGMDDTFTVGGENLRYPGDPMGSAENTINCRCAVGYVVQE